ncbi:MAG: VOC family protein [Myxococcota bacterium]
MALHRFIGIEIGAPAPDEIEQGYREIGLVGGDGRWGTEEVPDQIHLSEAPYRQLRSMRIGCEDEADLAALRQRLEALGIAAEAGSDRVACSDPSGHWQVIVEVAPPAPLRETPTRAHNRPGERARPGARADVVGETRPRPPRRLGHVVLGSPDPVGVSRFFLEGIGFRLSDQVAGVLSFMRCSTDHHNLLVQPAPVPHLNHYAFEYDDTDAVGVAGTRYLAERPDRHVVGIGRHVVGSNVFWYVNDPCGTMMEFYSDMDDIPDDDAWEVRTDWDIEFSRWGPPEPPPAFALPDDLEAIGRAQEAERR